MEKLSPPQDFVETMGMYFQGENMPRIAGRLYGLLLLEGGPFSFSELAERLDVSRASISTNARMLAAQGMIQRVAVPGDRQDHYAIEVKGLLAMYHRQVERYQQMCEWFHEKAEVLGDHAEGTRDRLAASAILLDAVLDGLRNGLKQVEARIEGPGPAK
ncbi:GbsR/MarR family transcriptional regulator [Shinella sp. G-2]|uniref:GbsR/MarR family transcriptional regulator n=1 Tax=Shinella sp. G-2 TaxID=3133141 RepID=UPI003CFD5802